MRKPKDFSKKSYLWKSSIDYRKFPECYRIGRGEQGVLTCEPYKSEILPFWRFKTPEIAKKSAYKIYRLFLAYVSANDFVGADMARKFLQMGYTRARRYGNYKSGRKYIDAKKSKTFTYGSGDEKKYQSAEFFYEKWQRAQHNRRYRRMKELWKAKYS